MINIIKSKDNDKIKYTKSLLKTKGRNKEKKFIIEGYRILTLALECDAKLEYVFINEDFEKKQDHKVLLEELENKNIKIYKTSNKIFSEMVDTENTQGILAILRYKERDLVNNINQDDKFVLILDRIQDPGNMGTIIRTADSAGVDAIILLKGCVDIYRKTNNINVIQFSILEEYSGKITHNHVSSKSIKDAKAKTEFINICLEINEETGSAFIETKLCDAYIGNNKVLDIYERSIDIINLEHTLFENIKSEIENINKSLYLKGKKTAKECEALIISLLEKDEHKNEYVKDLLLKARNRYSRLGDIE